MSSDENSTTNSKDVVEEVRASAQQQMQAILKQSEQALALAIKNAPDFKTSNKNESADASKANKDKENSEKPMSAKQQAQQELDDLEILPGLRWQDYQADGEEASARYQNASLHAIKNFSEGVQQHFEQSLEDQNLQAYQTPASIDINAQNVPNYSTDLLETIVAKLEENH